MSLRDLFGLEGKTAIVTGGGRGLGEHMARALFDAGASVVICSRKLEALQAVQEEIDPSGNRVAAISADVSNEDDVRRVVEHTVERFGSIDILVNNSGTTWGAPAADMPIEKFDQVIRVNVRGTFLMAQAVGKSMIERGSGGRIINIGSILALRGGSPVGLQAAGYSASKGAVHSLTRELAGSWAKHGINVNAILPGWFPTRMSQGVLEAAGDDIRRSIPLGRFGEPADIQGAVLYLASAAAAFVTGQMLVVDGGQTIW